MSTIYDFNDSTTQICPKCDSGRGYFTFGYGRQLYDEPMGLTVTCRCGYSWYERAADYEEPAKEQEEEQTNSLGMPPPRGYAGDPA